MAVKTVKGMLDKIVPPSGKQSSCPYYDPEDEDEEDDWGFEQDQAAEMRKRECARYIKFLEALPNCLPLTLGFHIPYGMDQDWCYCPCHRVMGSWRTLMDLDGDTYNCALNSNGRFVASGLIDHLVKLKRDVYHELILKYLETLYDDYYVVDRRREEEPLRHKAFYPKNSPKYYKAVKYEAAKTKRYVGESRLDCLCTANSYLQCDRWNGCFS